MSTPKVFVHAGREAAFRLPRYAGEVSDSRWLPVVLAVALLAACARSAPEALPSAGSSPTATATPSATATATATVPTPTPRPPSPDIWAKRLRIPSLGIDADVQESEVVAVTDAGDGGGGGGSDPGCVTAPATGPSPAAEPTAQAGPSPASEPSPTEAPAETTFTVPTEGIATPKDAFEFLRHRSWIFGHSRWLGVPGLFFGLDRIQRGDELYLDGIDRRTGEPIAGARFVVTGIYLSDIGTGGSLVSGERIGARETPLVILQTSVRESGSNRPWILDREMLLSKAENVVDGDVDDPCRYLLLFVVARYAP